MLGLEAVIENEKNLHRSRTFAPGQIDRIPLDSHNCFHASEKMIYERNEAQLLLWCQKTSPAPACALYARRRGRMLRPHSLNMDLIQPVET